MSAWSRVESWTNRHPNLSLTLFIFILLAGYVALLFALGGCATAKKYREVETWAVHDGKIYKTQEVTEFVRSTVVGTGETEFITDSQRTTYSTLDTGISQRLADVLGEDALAKIAELVAKRLRPGAAIEAAVEERIE